MILCAAALPRAAAGAETADFAPPPVGARWTYLRNGVPEEGRRVADREWRGRRLLAYERREEGRGFVDLFLALSGAWVATLRAGGEAVDGASPNNFALDWPLAEGRSWVARFTYEDYRTGRSEPSVIDWSVRAVRNFDTPFGRIRAFGLRGTSPGVVRGNWFAPALGLYYRQTVEEGGRMTLDRVLTDFSA